MRYPSVVIRLEPTNNFLYRKLQYPTYVKDIDLHVHIRVFKKTIKANWETMEIDINLFGLTLRDNILKWGENFVQDLALCSHQICTSLNPNITWCLKTSLFNYKYLYN